MRAFSVILKGLGWLLMPVGPLTTLLVVCAYIWVANPSDQAG